MRKNNFLEQLRRKQEAAKTTPASKPVSQMPADEIDQEEARLKAEIRRLREAEVAAQREAAKPSKFIFAGLSRRRRRPYWK